MCRVFRRSFVVSLLFIFFVFEVSAIDTDLGPYHISFANSSYLEERRNEQILDADKTYSEYFLNYQVKKTNYIIDYDIRKYHNFKNNDDASQKTELANRIKNFFSERLVEPEIKEWRIGKSGRGFFAMVTDKAEGKNWSFVLYWPNANSSCFIKSNSDDLMSESCSSLNIQELSS